MRNHGILSTIALALLMSACASKEDPAKQIVARADAGLAPVREDASVYAPNELKTAEDKLAAAKDDITWEHYQKVLEEGPALEASVAAVKDAVVAKKTQAAAATHEWTDLSETVPKIVEALQSRVDTLSKARKLPPEVKKETLESAKTELESMKTTWAAASAAFSAGQATEAADKGRTVKAKGEELLQQLGAAPV
jgi:hypothetical protein